MMMEGWKTKKSIRYRIFRYFLVVTAILGACLIFFFQTYEYKIKDVTTESMNNVLRKINMDTYDTLRNAQAVSYLVAHDSDIQKNLRSPLPEDQVEYYIQRVDENGRLYEINRYLQNVTGIYVIGENGALFRSVTSGTIHADYRGTDWYRKVRSQRSSIWLYSDEGSIMVRDYKRAVIDIVVPVIDIASSEYLGAVMGEVGIEKLKQITHSGMVFGGNLVMVSQDNEILYTDISDETVDLEKLGQAIEEAESEGGYGILNVGKAHQYLYAKMSLDVAGWYLVGLVDTGQVYGEVRKAQVIMLCMIIFCLILSVLISMHVSVSIARPIQEICISMKRVESGDLTARVKTLSKDEVGMLADSFNHMVVRIDELVREQKKKERELRISELKSLQAQINPHFLYNTLDSINWLARMGRIREVTETIDELSAFFRISLSQGRDFISIENELCHVENYILIQKKRYEKYLTYRMAIPEEVKGFLCLKMILQPLVENSIYHGIKEKGEKGMIEISAREEKDTIVFTVKDTGIGMTEEKLAELQQMMKKEIEYDKNAYGLINVQRRIRTCFGEQYGMRFASAWGKGTEVTVIIPKLKEVPPDVGNSSGRG